MIRLIPDFRQVPQHRAFELPRAVFELQFGHARLVERVHQLTVDVELHLGVRGIAGPYRLCAFVTGQPAHLPFHQPPLAHDAVHDLHVGRRSRRCAQQPIVPRGRLFGVAGVHQREQRERGVAQPAEAVIPVLRTTELFR